MHGGNQSKAFLDSTFTQGHFYVGGDVPEAAPAGNIEPEFFAVGFHDLFLILYSALWMILPECNMFRMRGFHGSKGD